MYCPNCGTYLEENTPFCTACGMALTSAAPVTSAASAPADRDGFPDPTVLPTPEQGRIDPNKLTPEPQPEQNIDIDSVVANLHEPEPEPVGSKNGFTEQDMAWFTDHQTQSAAQPTAQSAAQPASTYPQQPTYPQPANYSQPVYPQQPNYPQAPYPQQPMPGQTVPQFVPPVPVDLTPRKSNVLLGLIGAVVFSLIGCAIWTVIGSLGYISYLGALAMSFLTITGYKLLGKRYDVPGVLITLVVVALAVLVSNMFIDSILIATDADAMEVLGYLGYNNFSDVFLHFFDLVNDMDVILEAYAPGEGTMMTDFLMELGLSYVFSGIAFAVVAVPQYRASKHS